MRTNSRLRGSGRSPFPARTRALCDAGAERWRAPGGGVFRPRSWVLASWRRRRSPPRGRSCRGISPSPFLGHRAGESPSRADPEAALLPSRCLPELCAERPTPSESPTQQCALAAEVCADYASQRPAAFSRGVPRPRHAHRGQGRLQPISGGYSMLFAPFLGSTALDSVAQNGRGRTHAGESREQL